jgi:cysteine synthase A
MITNNVTQLIGNTPLIKLKYPSEISGCEIYGKAEFLNPAGSVKDRTALGIIEDAEEKKLLEPGGTVVEGTFGNTGIGLALVCNAKNYNLEIVMPNITVQSKRDILKNMGAKLHLVDAKPYSDPGNYQKVSQQLAKDIEKQTGKKTFCLVNLKI